jgi:hypothetical protein
MLEFTSARWNRRAENPISCDGTASMGAGSSMGTSESLHAPILHRYSHLILLLYPRRIHANTKAYAAAIPKNREEGRHADSMGVSA